MFPSSALSLDTDQTTEKLCYGLLAKLIWFRKGNEVSERQWRAILGILKTQTNLDAGYLKTWTKTTNVDDLLEKARRDGDGFGG